MPWVIVERFERYRRQSAGWRTVHRPFHGVEPARVQLNRSIELPLRVEDRVAQRVADVKAPSVRIDVIVVAMAPPPRRPQYGVARPRAALEPQPDSSQCAEDVLL